MVPTRGKKRGRPSETGGRNAPSGQNTTMPTTGESKHGERRRGASHPVPPPSAPKTGGTGRRDTEIWKAPTESAPDSAHRPTEVPNSVANENVRGTSSKMAVQTFKWPDDQRKCSCDLILFSN
jgi:hypothetical protein